jgi:cytosine/adenosine deaminase-related metal-dependent hydrolase
MSRLRLRARWVLPISSAPLDDAWVEVEDGRVAAIGQGHGDASIAERDLGRAVLMPGLVNAHTHLELSYLAGAVPPARRFTTWIRDLMAARRGQPEPTAPVIVEAARAAVQALVASGTAAVGDVSNTLVTVPILNLHSLAASVFFEVLRFRAREAAAVVADAAGRIAATARAPHVRVWLAPHAPYSVSPALFEAILAQIAIDPDARTSVHLAESQDENELLESGTGAFRDLLHELGAWDEAWVPPRCSPVEYLERLSFLGPRTLAVHGAQMSDTDLRRLQRTSATLVTCPRSNQHVGVGNPPIARFYDSGVPVAIGTDSLASAPDLDVWSELRAMRAIAAHVPACELIASATLVGARALGFGAMLGSIEPGKLAALISVEVPLPVDDVEEYLVGGIAPSQVQWTAVEGVPPVLPA